MKISIDGECYYLYALLLQSGGFITGFDHRPHHEVEAEWLKKQAVSAEREAKVKQDVMQANILLARVQQKGEFEEVEREDIGPPPVISLTEAELFRLRGLPDGTCAVSVQAGLVMAVAQEFNSGDYASAGKGKGRIKRGKQRG